MSPAFHASKQPHELHVLLRHRLLPQPGGFEGVWERSLKSSNV